jgi:Flp pilus assembly protein TadD
VSRSAAPVAALLLGFLVAPNWSQNTGGRAQAEADVRQGRPERAIPVLEKILAASPKDLKARNLLGIALLNAGRGAEAEAQFRAALRVDPNFVPALKNLAVSEMAEGRSEDSRGHFELVLRLSPKDPVAHLYLGESAFSRQRYREAVAHYDQSGGMHLKDPPVALHYVAAHIEAGNYHAAIAAGERLIQTGYAKAGLYKLLSRAYERSGRTPQAYDSLRTAAKLDPEDESNYLDLMAIALDHNDLELSLQISEVALERVPQAYGVRLQRGAVLALMGRPGDADQEFLEAIRLVPGENLGYVALAMVRMHSGKVAEAVEVLRARRSAAPEDYLVNRYLGEALSLQGALPGSDDETEAVAALETAIRQNGESAGAHVLLGKLRFARGELDRAAGEFEEALRLVPADVSPAYQLALVYRKLGNAKRAEELFDLYGKARQGEGDQNAVRALLRMMREGGR